MNPVDISLYAILDPHRANGRTSKDELAALAKAAVRGGATILQYRHKDADTRTMVNNARAILDAMNSSAVPLVINDRVDVALAVGAQGVHVGQDDMDPVDARRLLGPDAIIGNSNKTEVHATSAPVGGLDYAFIGGVFDTASKDNPTAIGLEGWQTIADHYRERSPRLPVGAIAGIDSSNIADVINAGADGVAVISAIFMEEDVEAATRNLSNIIEGSRS